MNEQEFDKSHDLTMRMMGAKTLGLEQQINQHAQRDKILNRELDRYEKHGIAIVNSSDSTGNFPLVYIFLNSLKELPEYSWTRQGQISLTRSYDNKKGQILIFARNDVNPSQIPPYAKKIDQNFLNYI